VEEFEEEAVAVETAFVGEKPEVEHDEDVKR